MVILTKLEGRVTAKPARIGSEAHEVARQVAGSHARAQRVGVVGVLGPVDARLLADDQERAVPEVAQPGRCRWWRPS
jgi:hypothetical protein